MPSGCIGLAIRRALVIAVLTSSVTRAAPPAICAATTERPTAPRIAVLSAFPAELAPLVAAADIEETLEVDGRSYYIGRLGGVRVVLGLLGIGMVNAAGTTASVIRHFTPAAIVVSGVAGSPHRIADVVVAAQWVDDADSRMLGANPALLALTRRAALALAPLERCTPIPPTDPNGAIRCLPFEPTVVFGGVGHSGDPYGGESVACAPGTNEVLGCHLPAAATAATAHATTIVVAEDMETTAVAREAARRGVPFIAMRAVSDGSGDPLGDRGFPAQFFDYYRLAAANAARVTSALLIELSALRDTKAGRRVCRLLAHHRWRRATGALATGDALDRPPAGSGRS